MDGVTATRRLREDDAHTPILALTTFDDDEALAGMLRAGASGFVLKGAPAEEGKVFLQIVPSPWNNASAGSFRVRISMEWKFFAVFGFLGM